ncbi:TM2 domain-containing protein [Staphylococcus simulans]|uniref:TM2 domain-containing protein n=1 Tax=Staphylococcus simulans TaxID=1286 RepID=UPI000D04141D|nr:TM2 domain-containing protein [Staphylococcus simulans]MCD8914412.1 TM2 domain-containing protein [Staphylococcus simulans]
MRVNKIVYIVLALFLGNFGVHKFYSGQNGQAILHLAFFWTGIPHVIAIISAIKTLLFRPADKNGNIKF